MIAVVIPYFQREPGILRRALASIAAQRDLPLPVHVLVVDDASPVPAAGEVAAMPAMPHPVQVILQPNAGPGGARNTGLSQLPAGTRYVAFLDSDDEWTPDHLARAVAALQAGFDFYFSDHVQLGSNVGAFARAGRIDPSRHPAIASPHEDLHAYQGDLFDQVFTANVIGTSTVVYDATRFGAQRFMVEFASAGEDYLFWMSIAQAGARAAFSSRCEATYGRGVNVYASSGWGTEAHLRRIHDEMRFKKISRQLFKLTTRQDAHVGAAVAALRIAFARDLMHRLAHRKRTPLKLLLAQLALDPMSYLMLLPNAGRIVLKQV